MTPKIFNEMFAYFKKGKEAVLIMNHYELADYMRINLDYVKDAEDWKEFLLDNRIQEYIKKEFSIISESNMRKIIAAVDADDRSAGRAQLINAMLSANNDKTNKREGNIVIYAYILPNEKQAKAPNTEVIKRDPFTDNNE